MMDNAKLRLPLSRKLRKAGLKAKGLVNSSAKQNLIIFGAMIVLILVFYILNPNFLRIGNIISMSQSLAPYAILALGVTFVIATGGIDLSIGTVCIASAVVSGYCYMKGMPLWLTIPMMIAIGGLFGLLNGVLVAKLKMPAFIATLGTMLVARGLSSLIVAIPNIFFPTGSWFNEMFSRKDSFPSAIPWVIGIMLVCMYIMFKNKIGRYILSIGSNEEATRLSGIDTDKYKIIAYVFSGIGAGIGAIFWAASFTTVQTSSGNGMELDAIAGVYIGGTSAAGGIASVGGSVIGSVMLVIIRNGLNFYLATLDTQVNGTYVTYVVTGIIVVVAVLVDIFKNKQSAKVKIEKPLKQLKRIFDEKILALEDLYDETITNGTLSAELRAAKLSETREEINNLKAERTAEVEKLRAKQSEENMEKTRKGKKI